MMIDGMTQDICRFFYRAGGNDALAADTFPYSRLRPITIAAYRNHHDLRCICISALQISVWITRLEGLLYLLNAKYSPRLLQQVAVFVMRKISWYHFAENFHIACSNNSTYQIEVLMFCMDLITRKYEESPPSYHQADNNLQSQTSASLVSPTRRCHCCRQMCLEEPHSTHFILKTILFPRKVLTRLDATGKRLGKQVLWRKAHSEVFTFEQVMINAVFPFIQLCGV